MTDLDWSPELWLANHDDDEQNVRLASQLWEENGLDVPESFFEDLAEFLSRSLHGHLSSRLLSVVAGRPPTQLRSTDRTHCHCGGR